ncbi:secretion system type II protein DotB/TraJ [Acetobacter indonesiensis NRIC 0313]|uniref:Dot/Icm secretion system ATPase DotB n=1 Tax=Acetobacter indonesiensis TaxID=104101 RepID=A0A6N3T8H6_9PROT|nr:ATPase, T2SS/T4P/T4SS family [Acetobacter indonesiensis]GAN63302.1 secretion system type II protein DotB/TraJ [Acetobacter indonesiensis]GBQ61884.1 secretion system type II protein DotB/TraJ [Acetobacter indonesiensis NRIC 0313]GEN03869.1 Dot/Icm secretion system ATPase DotB [Acetobacter indonesiensis]
MNFITSSKAERETWPNEGRPAYSWVVERRKQAPGLDDLLKWAYGLGASRIDFKTGHPVTIMVHGKVLFATRFSTDDFAISDIVSHMYAQDGMSMLAISHDLDSAYSVSLNRRETLRFRVNFTPCEVMRGQGVNIVMRPIPSRPPSLESQLVEPEVLASNDIVSGMKLIGGVTGSGKSSLAFALAEEKVMRPDANYNIATGEHPIEFLMDYIRSPTGSKITQTPIHPPHMTFAKFVRGTTRREMTELIVGECRDSETMDAAINCAITGGILGTTIHADNVGLMMQRAVSLCAREERDNLVSALAQSMRFCLNQRLLPRKGGGRVAIREFLTFDRDLRFKLMRTDPQSWPEFINDVLKTDGQSFARAIEARLEQDLITEEVALMAKRRDD